MRQLAAEAAITGAGLTVGAITGQYNETVFLGQVISQGPSAGTSVASGTRVNLVISWGIQGDQTVMLPGGVPLELMSIPGGTFMMGCDNSEQDCGPDEGPPHEVTVPDFLVGKYEVTKRQWRAVMGTTPWSGQAAVLDDPDSPAVYVSWNDAAAFITALNTSTGLTFRLPSEAEWQYACRAGTETRFYWGDDATFTEIGDYAWCYSNTQDAGESYAHLVGQKLPNAFELCDMSGNVWELCEDDWHDDFTGAPADGSAWVGDPRGSYRVGCGGGWASYMGRDRSAERNDIEPDYGDSIQGLRVVLTD